MAFFSPWRAKKISDYQKEMEFAFALAEATAAEAVASAAKNLSEAADAYALVACDTNIAAANAAVQEAKKFAEKAEVTTSAAQVEAYVLWNKHLFLLIEEDAKRNGRDLQTWGSALEFLEYPGNVEA